MKKKLVYIPIIHQCFEKRNMLENILGKKKVEQFFSETNEFWKRVDIYIKESKLKIDKIFLEGWRGTKDELNELEEDIEKKANGLTTGKKDKLSNMILSLISKGAVLIKTESEELVDKELKFNAKLNIINKNYNETKVIALNEAINNTEEIHVLRNKRDMFIAKQINENLLPNETGILFIGSLHNVISYISGEIEIIKNSDLSNLANSISQILR